MARDVTQLLVEFRSGDRSAFDRLIPLVYEDLRRVAHRQLRRVRSGDTLDTTVLVHEVYLKMADQSRLGATDRDHFLAIAACAMRQVIADAARRRTAAKRGGPERDIPLEDAPAVAAEEARWLLDMDRALDRLAELDERMARVVECRFYAGYSEEETARALDSSVRTVQRDWRRAKAWLREALGDGAGGPTSP